MADESGIYVVDDDDAMRDSLDFLLAAAGFSVKVFESASSFLGVLARVQAGCLVTDIRMPGMDGLELLKRVKRERPLLPVIIMTGHGDVPLAVEAMKLGANDFIEKPFEDQRLVDIIRAAMTERHRRAQGRDGLGANYVSRRRPQPARASGAGGPRHGTPEQSHRARLRHQPPHGGGLSRQCDDQDASGEPIRTRPAGDASRRFEGLSWISAHPSGERY